MPEERDIEKSLRAWAKRRREDAGAPLDLHPATRNLLQDEAARLKTGPRREPGAFARLLWGSPLRLALNLSALAVLIFAVAVFLPRLEPASSSLSSSPALLAENKRLPDRNAQPAVAESVNPGNAQPVPAVETASTIAAPPPTPAVAARKAKPVTTSVALADNSSLYKTPVASAASAAPGVAPPVPAAALPLSLDEEKSATHQAGVSGLAAAPANEPMAAAPAKKLSWINSPANADRRDGAVAKPGAAPMLASFRTEQAGNQLRVIDADGSIYIGNLTASTEILDSKAASRIAQTRAFRVTGTNLTRHVPVVFTGNLIFDVQSSLHGQKDVSGTMVVNGGIGGGGGFGGAGTNRVVTYSGATPIPGSIAQTAVVGGALPAQPQFRVEGRAVIGTNEIQINAVPVAP